MQSRDAPNLAVVYILRSVDPTAEVVAVVTPRVGFVTEGGDKGEKRAARGRAGSEKSVAPTHPSRQLQATLRNAFLFP